MLYRCFIFSSVMLLSLSAEARHHSGIDITISALPPPAQVIVTPPHDYSHCYVTRGMWIDGMWIPAHQECVYPQTSRTAVWVSGYWGCVVPGRHGRCGKWKWHSNHWVRNASPQDVHIHDHGYTNRHSQTQTHEHRRLEAPMHTHQSDLQHRQQSTIHTR